MLLEFVKNSYILTALCTLAVFVEMFWVKKVYTTFTTNIKNVKVRTAANIVFGIVTCFVLSTMQMWALCDVIGGVFAWKWVAASTLGATLIYVLLEKIFGNAVVNELGRTLANYISHSDMFDGKITEKGVITVAEKLLEKINKVDNALADKENQAIEAVVKRLDDFLADGQVTITEKAVATELINIHNIDVTNSTYEKYKALLKK